MVESSARPVDRVVGGYLVLSAAALLLRPGPWLLVLFVAHIAAAAALFTDRLEPVRRFAAGHDADGGRSLGRKTAGVVVDWYPLLLIPFLYKELPVLNTAAWGGHTFDALLQGWEAAAFGGQPAITMSRRWGSLWVSEPLHLAYLLYYPILYAFPAVVYLRRSRQAFHDTLFAMLLAFAVHYMAFIYFPVKGPYFVFPAPDGELSRGIFYKGVHFVLGTGASAGTAFPSSHVALSTVQTVNAIRYYPVAAPLIAVATLGVAVGAVYAGVHYAIDTSLGLVTGGVVALLVPAVRKRLE